jgi:cytochrome b subunit of formate dehydrogenase
MERKDEILRLDVHQRIQHYLLIISVTLLILTGAGMRFSSSFLGKFLIFLEGGFKARGLIHRFSALLLLITLVYHLLYIIFSERGHGEFMKIILKWKDVREYWQTLLYNLRLRNEKPKLDWYCYREKFQYWAFALFIFLMLVSGVILWLYPWFFGLLPKWAFDIALEIHGWTGTLILIFLVLWHLYIVHLSPSKFPMSKSWLTGKISLKELKEDHEKFYEEHFGKGG